jgi:2-oxoisovalerate dehydrogenase E1 component
VQPDRVSVVEENLDRYLASAAPPERLLADHEPLRAGGTLTALQAVRLYEDQLLSRQLDIAARRLKAEAKGFYTIASAGHEQNAVVAAQLRPTDPGFLHYRSGGFMMARSRQLASATPTFDTLLSFCASRDEPISGGRHKVWGSRALHISPQTSTIASHLPKAVGMAFALGRSRRIGVESKYPEGSIVCCSFGDASSNHATALAGVNSARYASRRGNPVPILFLCEDNGIGISVETPPRWITDAFSSLRHLRYFEADGPLDAVWETVRIAIDTCRATRSPVFLHLRTVRLWGHAGSDVETAYRGLSEIERIEGLDPILRNAQTIVESGAATPERLRGILGDLRERVAAAEQVASGTGHLSSLAEVGAPLAPYDEERCRVAATESVPDADRRAFWGDKLPEDASAPSKRTLGARITAALADEMLRRPEIIVFGEDVGRKGGVYHVTAGLQKRFGQPRVFDTLLDETTILGAAQGAAQAGLLPVPEIQYLAYVHNAIDQIRGEASTLSYFSSGQFTNPMVIRIASFAYQRGFGGHFHNDNSIGALREIPGLVIAAPARGEDAARMLRGAFALARENGRVVAFLEPIALYHEKDLYEPGDGLWLSDYPAPGAALLPGETHTYGKGDLLLVSYANGLRLSLRAAKQLREQHGIDARVLDLRWLNPLPWEALDREAASARAVVVVDECRATGAGIADAVVAHLAEGGYRGTLASVRAADCLIPLGPAAHTVLVSEEQIVAAAREAIA